MDQNKVEILQLRQHIMVLKSELKEVLKAVDRFRKEYAMTTYIKEFDRKVSLDFEDPLYPYCPFRLRENEIKKYIKHEKNS